MFNSKTNLSTPTYVLVNNTIKLDRLFTHIKAFHKMSLQQYQFNSDLVFNLLIIKQVLNSLQPNTI